MKGDGKRPEFKVYTIRDSIRDFNEKRSKKRQISSTIYKAIIKKYLTIYINELLFFNRGLYFPLMGKAKLNRCGNWIRKDYSNFKVAQQNKLKVASASLGIYWYHRPFSNMFYLTLKKMTGTTNLFPVLEKEWKKNNDASALPSVKELTNSRDTRIVKRFRR